MTEIRFTLNGSAQSVDVRAGESLLETLRTRCGVFSTKDGCQPQGQCGCCLALVDGKPKVTCAVPAERVEGAHIVTLEGLPSEERELTARCFATAAGLQCGYCIPGFALQAKALLDANPQPDREEIARAVNGHLCRCTGYTKILDSIELLARARRGEVVPEPCRDGRVGSSLARFTGQEMTLGDRPYVDDLVRPGMLHGAVVLSPHARARVLGIDVRAAAAHPGVVAVVWADPARLAGLCRRRGRGEVCGGCIGGRGGG